MKDIKIILLAFAARAWTIMPPVFVRATSAAVFMTSSSTLPWKNMKSGFFPSFSSNSYIHHDFQSHDHRDGVQVSSPELSSEFNQKKKNLNLNSQTNADQADDNENNQKFLRHLESCSLKSSLKLSIHYSSFILFYFGNHFRRGPRGSFAENIWVNRMTRKKWLRDHRPKEKEKNKNIFEEFIFLCFPKS